MKRVVLMIAIAAVAVPVSGQAPSKPATAPREYKAPRTPDGHPDLQGYWTTQTFTPLQRPKRYADKAFLTEEEFAELTKLVTQGNVDPLAGNVLGAEDEQRAGSVEQRDVTHYDNALWLTTAKPKSLTSRRTSLITDPPDGRIPPLTADGQARAAARRANAGFDSYENRPMQERCIVWTHEGPPMIPPPYNDIYRIMQTPGYFTILREVNTNLPRFIPTDGRPHLIAAVRQYAGDSRGRWEGDTLVVETTNFNEKIAFQGGSAEMRVTERFTRVSADEIRYQFTVDDPKTWTRPWTAEIPMMKTTGPLYEYACHEGNYGAPNILRGARAADQRKAAAAAKPTTRQEP
jgi:hypothetical protein